MPLIYCHFNLFDYNQNIYIVKENGIRELAWLAPTEEVGYAIASLCNERKIYNINLYGTEEYVNTIVDDIYNIFNLKYENALNLLRIEVNNNEISN